MASDPSSSTPFRTSDDLALVQRVVDRRPEALAELYDRYAPLLLAVTRRILSRPAEAEEALQETFFQAWSQAESFDSGLSSVSTWLVLLARGRALERLRQRRLREGNTAGVAMDSVAPGLPGFHDEVAMVHERRLRVRKAMAALSAEQREVLELAFFDGLTLTEIAERSSAAVAIVRRQALQAMKKLRRDLRAEIRERM